MTRASADHHVVIAGRRWRATDPEVPEPLRLELVDELMSARRAVGAALRTDAVTELAAARRRVDDAKVALGERGHPWWEPSTEEERAPRIRSALRALSGHRAPDRSICPSDVARCVGGASWRPLMDEVRAEARSLAVDGVVHLTKGEDVLDPSVEPRGPIRIRSGPSTTRA